MWNYWIIFDKIDVFIANIVLGLISVNPIDTLFLQN